MPIFKNVDILFVKIHVSSNENKTEIWLLYNAFLRLDFTRKKNTVIKIEKE